MTLLSLRAESLVFLVSGKSNCVKKFQGITPMGVPNKGGEGATHGYWPAIDYNFEISLKTDSLIVVVCRI